MLSRMIGMIKDDLYCFDVFVNLCEVGLFTMIRDRASWASDILRKEKTVKDKWLQIIKEFGICVSITNVVVVIMIDFVVAVVVVVVIMMINFVVAVAAVAVVVALVTVDVADLDLNHDQETYVEENPHKYEEVDEETAKKRQRMQQFRFISHLHFLIVAFHVLFTYLPTFSKFSSTVVFSLLFDYFINL